MNQLKRYTIIGTIFVIILGALAHFFYDWSNQNVIVGLFAPVNESTWEHMKLAFFPMLLFSVIAIPRLKENYPCITSSLLSGILIGTVLIPVIFYSYTGILGYNVFILDLLTFVFAIIIAFCAVYRFALSCRMQNVITPLCVFVCVFFVFFVLFTFYPPHIGLFTATI